MWVEKKAKLLPIESIDTSHNSASMYQLLLYKGAERLIQLSKQQSWRKRTSLFFVRVELICLPS